MNATTKVLLTEARANARNVAAFTGKPVYVVFAAGGFHALTTAPPEGNPTLVLDTVEPTRH
jgi:hypothetical protein